MKNNPLVSIITPCFNNNETIIETIESVKNQSYGSIEHIIVDDGSIIPVEKTIQKYLPFVKLLRQENSGVAAARNLAVKNSSGDILVFLDSDDLIDKDYVKKVVNAFLTENDVAMVACYVTEIGRSRNKIEIPPFNLESFYYHNNLFPSIIAVKKILFDKVDGYNKDLIVCEDWDLYLKITEINSRVYIIPEYLFFYRKHSELSSLTDLMSRDKSAVHQAYYQLYQSRKEIYNKRLVSPLNVAYLKMRADKRVSKTFKVIQILLLLNIIFSILLMVVRHTEPLSIIFNLLFLFISIFIYLFIYRSKKKLKQFDLDNIPKINTMRER